MDTNRNCQAGTRYLRGNSKRYIAWNSGLSASWMPELSPRGFLVNSDGNRDLYAFLLLFITSSQYPSHHCLVPFDVTFCIDVLLISYHLFLGHLVPVGF